MKNMIDTLPFWITALPIAVTVCDRDGIIIYMNDRSVETFAADGGEDLIGRNVLDCHPEPSRTQLATMLQTGERNVYTIEKAGKRKMIYQTPWYDNGAFAGIVELSLELPAEMPHFVRSAT
jgi:PAS domain-containing protein